jgi:uncharacterized protein (TIGR00369 family)
MTDDEARPATAERSLDNLPPSPLANAMGIELLAASPERVVGTMRVEGNTQPFGLMHGGATCVLAETLGSVGAWMHAGPGRIAVGVDINATHHRAMRSGVVTGVATPAHLGRSVATYDVLVSDERGRRVATARITCHIVADPG